MALYQVACGVTEESDDASSDGAPDAFPREGDDAPSLEVLELPQEPLTEQQNL